MAASTSNGWMQNGVSPNPDDRLAQTRAQVDEVVVIMQENVRRIQERESKLSDLETRSESLAASASVFQTSSSSVRRKMWWKNLKWTLVLGAVIVVILLVVIIYFSTGNGGGDGGSAKILEALLDKSDDEASEVAIDAAVEGDNVGV